MKGGTMSFYKDLLKYAGDEKILSIVIGEMGWSDYNDEEKPPYKHIIGKLLSIEEAKEYLDYYCSYGFGAPEHHAICAWTSTLIIFTTQYDGATGFESFPRNPTEYVPDMPGG